MDDARARRRGEYGALCARVANRHRCKTGGRRRQRLVLADAGAAQPAGPEQPAESAQLARDHGPRCRAREHGGGRRRRRDSPRRPGPFTPRPLATPGHKSHGRAAPCIFGVSPIAPPALCRGTGENAAAASMELALHNYFYRRPRIAYHFRFRGVYIDRHRRVKNGMAPLVDPFSPPKLLSSGASGQVELRTTTAGNNVRRE